MRGAVVSIALSRKKDSLLSVNGGSFSTIDIARIFDSFFFETTMLYLKAGHNLGL